MWVSADHPFRTSSKPVILPLCGTPHPQKTHHTVTVGGRCPRIPDARPIPPSWSSPRWHKNPEAIIVALSRTAHSIRPTCRQVKSPHPGHASRLPAPPPPAPIHPPREHTREMQLPPAPLPHLSRLPLFPAPSCPQSSAHRGHPPDLIRLNPANPCRSTAPGSGSSK